LTSAAILPVKRFAAAKSRLATGIDGERRRTLAAAMLEDVLTAISSARQIDRMIVVTADPGAAEQARADGAEVVADHAEEGHSAAALAGVARALEAGAERAILLAGDCPLLDPRDVDRLLTAVPERWVAVVPDRHGTGTNALVLAPPDAIEPAFGEGSCERHVGAARGAGVPYAVEHVESLALDLDTPADVVALTRALEGRRGRRAPRTARALGIR
jgi:2-phospho-L-lactate guanylyltransferase